jgi:hypothetical protein
MDWHALADSVPAALTTFGVIAASAIGVAVKIAKVWRAVQDERMKTIPPVAPMPALPANPFGADPSLTGKLLEASVSIARADWAMGELRDELRQCREERDEIAGDAKRTAAALARSEVQLVAKRRELISAQAKLATLEQARDQWKAIAELRQQEVDELQAKVKTDPPPRR